MQEFYEFSYAKAISLILNQGISIQEKKIALLVCFIFIFFFFLERELAYNGKDELYRTHNIFTNS